ncbi:GOLPH3/VPS74 family protein [Cerasicoccus maritimus]|uniref:GOLPH3/VPS74 family protein n=1 Tax=Cerasicoccus maritimus TaxID=490089 RepID=UPI002852828D|nr:GPP34 family phosphoprotein [Cerasicoccus maritimus]
MSLRFAEEILLLALDDESGKLHPLPEGSLGLAISGALIMELAFAGVLDSDDKNVTVISRDSTGDALLDDVLAKVPQESPLSIQRALNAVNSNIDGWKTALFEELKQRGILKQEEHRFLFVLKERRYPVIDDSEEQEVKSRIREVVLDHSAIPDPRDVVIICLMDACDLSSVVFTDEERAANKQRIETIAKMDFVGQALSQAVAKIQQALLEVMAYSGM